MADNSQYLNRLARANQENEGIEHLDKSEAIYYLDHVLTGDMPEEHPDDHNGSATRAQIKEWAQVVAEHRELLEGDD